MGGHKVGPGALGPHPGKPGERESSAWLRIQLQAARFGALSPDRAAALNDSLPEWRRAS